MLRLLRTILVVLVCSCTACATQGIAPSGPDDTRQLKIGVGSVIHVVTTDRERLGLKVAEIRPDSVVGITRAPLPRETCPEGVRVEIPYTDLALVEVTHFDAKGTARFVVTLGVLAAVPSAYPIGLGMPPP